MEDSMEAAMRNFMREGYKGVTESWNVLQHEVRVLRVLRECMILVLCVEFLFAK